VAVGPAAASCWEWRARQIVASRLMWGGTRTSFSRASTVHAGQIDAVNAFQMLLKGSVGPTDGPRLENPAVGDDDARSPPRFRWRIRESRYGFKSNVILDRMCLATHETVVMPTHGFGRPSWLGAIVGCCGPSRVSRGGLESGGLVRTSELFREVPGVRTLGLHFNMCCETVPSAEQRTNVPESRSLTRACRSINAALCGSCTRL